MSVNINNLTTVLEMAGTNHCEIETTEARYTLNSEFVDVFANVVLNGVTKVKVFTGQIENTEDWSDEDVMNFAVTALENYLVS